MKIFRIQENIEREFHIPLLLQYTFCSLIMVTCIYTIHLVCDLLIKKYEKMYKTKSITGKGLKAIIWYGTICYISHVPSVHELYNC